MTVKLGKLECHMQKNKIGPVSYNIHKYQLRMDKVLSIRLETVTLLEENKGKVHDIRFGRDFTNMTQIKHRPQKASHFIRCEVGTQHHFFYLDAQISQQHLLKGPSCPHHSVRPPVTYVQRLPSCESVSGLCSHPLVNFGILEFIES